MKIGGSAIRRPPKSKNSYPKTALEYTQDNSADKHDRRIRRYNAQTPHESHGTSPRFTLPDVVTRKAIRAFRAETVSHAVWTGFGRANVVKNP